MADVSKVKLPSGTTYNIKDKNALPLTGGSVTGPVSFGDSVSIDEATVGDLVVNGSASFTNNLQANTINGVTVGNNPKFTDTNTVTTATTTGSGNAVTAVTASNGALTITKGTTFLTSHQDISGKADKSATVSTVAYDSTNKKITKTINGTTSDVVTVATLKTALDYTASDIGIAFDFTTSGNNRAVQQDSSGNLYVTQKDNNTNTTYTLSGALSSHKFTSTLTAGGNGSGTSTSALILAAGSNITLTDNTSAKAITIAATDTKVTTAALTSGTTYYPILATGTGTATRQIDSTLQSFTYKATAGTTSTNGTSTLELGNSIASGTANNQQGGLVLYSTTRFPTAIKAGTLTAGRTLTLPDKTGTVALTDDIVQVQIVRW